MEYVEVEGGRVRRRGDGFGRWEVGVMGGGSEVCPSPSSASLPSASDQTSPFTAQTDYLPMRKTYKKLLHTMLDDYQTARRKQV